MWDDGLTFALDYQAFLVSSPPALRRKLQTVFPFESKHSVSTGLSCFTATPRIVQETVISEDIATVPHFGEGFGANCFSRLADANRMKRATSSFL